MVRSLRPLVALATRLMLARYLLASVCALSFDMLAFLALAHSGAPAILAAFGGYTVGLIVHWNISVRFVFDTGRAASHAQRAGFVASALVGMGMTLAAVGALSVIGMTPVIAKLFSVPASFFTVYAIRKYGVFARV